MKLPNLNAFEVLERVTIEDSVVVQKLKKPESINFHIHKPDLDDDKATNNYIKKVVKMVRTSDEYRRYISFLKSELDIRRCSFLSNIDFSKDKKITLEFHHYPFNIFEIVKTVYTDMVKKSRKVDPFTLSDEVMKLHYEGLIGLVPLSLTAHQLAHTGALFIPLDVPIGDVKAFIKRYNGALTDELKDSLRNLILLTQQQNEDYGTMALDKQITLLDIEDITPRRKVVIKPTESQNIS